MKRLLQYSAFLAVILLSSLVLSTTASAQQADKVRDGVFLHISHGADAPHRLLMALKMAVTMAEGDRDVLVYCDIEAVTFEPFPSSVELLSRLAELKVKVLACPTCMKVAHVEASALRAGVQVAQRDLFFSFTKGRILSLDY